MLGMLLRLSVTLWPIVDIAIVMSFSHAIFFHLALQIFELLHLFANAVST